MRRLSPTVIAAIVGVLVVLLLLFVFAGTRGGNSDKLSDDQVAGKAASDPEKSCASQPTYDLIKRELFRRAAELRGTDKVAFDKLAAYAVVRMDSPMLKGHDENIGTITCTGTLALDLPPGVAVVGGRRTLTADIEYALQPAADGSGTVLTLGSADGIIAPLATLARVGGSAVEPMPAPPPSDPGNPVGAEPPPPVQAPPPQAQPRPEPQQPQARPTASANPSFNCRNARTRGEIAVCNDGGLASLDRQMAGQFNRAISEASPAERSLLQSTRGRFLAYRDSCRSDSCIADAYRGRITEIGDIMAGRWRSPR